MTNHFSAGVHVVTGDLFKSKAQTLINTVNTVGVMGKGVALQFKRRYPEMYRDYEARCQRGAVRLGEPYFYKQPHPPHIINFPTKDHWRSVSRLKDIVAGLDHLALNYRSWGVTSLAVPPLGCGNGQLEWTVVGPTLYRKLAKLDIPVELYAPHGTPHEELRPAFLQESLFGDVAGTAESPPAEHIQPSWVALLAALDGIQADPHHWPVGKTSLQKLAYFGTEAGIPTGLRFEHSTYGPYAPELNKVVSKLVNHDLLEQRSMGRMIAHTVGSTYESAAHGYEAQLATWSPAVHRLVDLFARLRTTRDAEVAATVHYVAAELNRDADHPPTLAMVLRDVLAWKQNKRPPLTSDELKVALASLAMLGWLSLDDRDAADVDEMELVGGV